MAAKKRPDTTPYAAPSAITPSLWWVGRGGWGALPALTPEPDCNIYLLKGEAFDVLIDCGMTASLAELEANIRYAGSDPARIGEIWLTHAHYDHFLRAGYWAARYPHTRCRISHRSLAFLHADDLRLIGLYRPEDFRRLGFAFLPNRAADLTLPRELLPLRERDVLQCPPHVFQVEELPGHVPDQLGFRGSVDGITALFSGDAVLGDQGPVKGHLGWLDGYWLSSVKDYRATLERLTTEPFPELLLPGHGRPHAGASARRSLQNCLRRINRLAALPDLASMMPAAWPP